MINPPSEGTFSIPENSIFQITRLIMPTMGRTISSAHCGNEPRIVARGSSLFAGAVPLLLNALILQRPFLIYELDVNSRHAVRARAARPNRRMCRNPVLIAGHANETSKWNFQGREKGGAFRADVFSDGVLTLNNLAGSIDYVDTHIHWNVVPGVRALI